MRCYLLPDLSGPPVMNRITWMQDRAWPQGQNMPCAPTDQPMPNLTEGVLNTQPEVRA